MFIYGGGVLRCSLNLSPKALPNSPVHFSLQPAWVNLKHVDHPTFPGDGILVLGSYQKVPDSVSSLEMNLSSSFITNILKTLIASFGIGDN